MSKFSKDDSVWFHPTGGLRKPAKVVYVNAVLTGLYYVSVQGRLIAAVEQRLSHRPKAERVGGLAVIRHHMAQEAEQAKAAMDEHLRQAEAATELPDHMLTAEQLRDKYDTEKGWGWHPHMPAESWRHEVAVGNTRLGYWDWAVHQLQE